MILSNTPQNEAVLSNVGEIGEFRIRNSAKAFNILSSGLYANKVKAIIRELSCNAVDSHTAAGTTKPFDVHLPSQLSPYFYIRDYGTGLSHDQVTNIYTTYFESTKTTSNEFIGALGLGSKSPFSYTDNFTVTAIKDGRKGIYTAFINDSGVPSIALMTEEETTEEPGVEVRFAVESLYDFGKFKDEASSVYRWFKQRPNFVGVEPHVESYEYETTDLIPGVHVRKTEGYGYSALTSYAVMGNIAYPIEVPSADKALEELHKLLKCGLVMEFGIGELDFQASREGLSYIPQTIQAIKSKLKAVNVRLADFVAEEADKLDNEWERAWFLQEKRRNVLFAAAVDEYATRTDFKLVADGHYSTASVSPKVTDLAEFNICIKAFDIYNHNTKCKTRNPSSVSYLIENGKPVYASGWPIHISKRTFFVENDTKVGAFERAKHHWRTDDKRQSDTVFVLEKIDRAQPMNLTGFYAMMHNPPECQVMKASTLRQKDRVKSTGLGRNVTILRMEERGGARWHNSSHDLVWRDGGHVDDFDPTKEYYYIPLSGFVPQWKNAKLANVNCSSFVNTMNGSGIKDLPSTVYGIRKGDIEDIKTRKNWINLEDKISDVLTKLGVCAFLGAVRGKLDNADVMRYNIDMIAKELPVDSPALELLNDFVGVPKADNYHNLQWLTDTFCQKFDMTTLVQKHNVEVRKFRERYPLIDKLDNYCAKEKDIIDYIKLVDSVKIV